MAKLLINIYNVSILLIDIQCIYITGSLDGGHYKTLTLEQLPIFYLSSYLWPREYSAKTMLFSVLGDIQSNLPIQSPLLSSHLY
jgi:hypothetical protein